MSYQSDIFDALTDESTISAIVGDRIFADVADGSTATPYLTFQVVSTSGETTHDGVREIEFPSIQFNCWATGREDAIALASAVNAFLDGSTLSGQSGISFQFSNQFGTYESDTKLFGEILEYRAACSTN